LRGCLNYSSLIIFRAIQGVGIGGEVPVAAAYINELSKAHRRGRFFLLYEIVFGLGLTSAGLVGYWAVPRIGWQSMFLLGAVPAWLALALRWLLPESPRWLASHGRLEEADRVIRKMEAHVPHTTPLGTAAIPPTGEEPATRWMELFNSRYRRRTLTVWTIWFCCYFVTYGLITWLPTIYRTVFHVDVATALRFGLATNAAGLAGDLVAALSIDRTGRRAWLGLASGAGAVPLAALWMLGATDLRLVVLCASLSYLFVGSNSLDRIRWSVISTRQRFTRHGCVPAERRSPRLGCARAPRSDP
jgi:putative MFS transporter